MAAISSAASGNWSAGATWVGGIAPTSADTVTILNTHTVTLDTTGCACTSLSVTGTLTCSTSASSDITVSTTITINANGVCDIDVSGNVAVVNTFYLASGGATATSFTGAVNANKISFKGYARKRWTNITTGISAGATQATLDDITGWQIGDVVAFGTTNPNSQGEHETVTVTNIIGSTIYWTGGVTYAHATGGYVGNLSSNCIIRSYTPTQAAGSSLNINIQQEPTTKIKLFSQVQFMGLHGSYYGGLRFYTRYWQSDSLQGVLDCAFYDTWGSACAVNAGHVTAPIERNVFYSNNVHSTAGYNLHLWVDGSFKNSQIKQNLFMRLNPGSTNFALRGYNGDVFTRGYVELVENVYCGINHGMTQMPYAKSYREKWVCGSNLSTAIIGYAEEFSFKQEFGDTNSQLFDIRDMCDMVLKDCLFNSGTMLAPYWVSSLSVIGAPDAARITIVNKNADVTQQEIWTNQSYTQPTLYRENTIAKRSVSSIAIHPYRVASDTQRTRQVPCANGKTIRVIGYVQFDTNFYNSNDYTAPTVTLSGLGATPQTYTATSAANGAWEQFDLSITNASGNDGNFTLTYTANAKTVTTGTVYFDGVPDDPFVTKCRHYGYRYDETNPVRVVNPTVSANEATAAAYTGITVTGSTSAISLGADRTFQILYDYTQAWACTTANLGYEVPLTGAGVAGNAALFAVGNITTTGWTLNGAGTLDMGSLTLTASLPWVYTYTGGTFSQATTVPTFNGGTLNIGAAGTFTFTMAGSTIVSMTPTAPGTYAMGAGSFTGTIDLRNTSGTHAITVELPTGTSYTTANNTGATITVSVPTVSADISVTGMPDAAGASCRLQIFNASAVSAAAWQATTAYSAGDMVLRTTGIGTESTAGLYMRCTTAGTSGGTEPTWNTTPGGTTADGTVVWTTYKVLFHDADPASTSYATTYIDGEEFLAGETVTVRFAEMDAGTTFKRYSTSTIPTASGFSVLVDETADEVYADNALDGSSYESTFSPDFVANYIILDTNTDFSGKSAYAYFCYTLTTSNGMYRFWGGVTALDTGNYRIETDVLNLYFDESAGFVKQTDSVRVYRKDGVRPALDPTTGGYGIEMNWRVPVNVVSTGGSALTPTESAQLMSLTNAPSAATVATAVWDKTLP